MNTPEKKVANPFQVKGRVKLIKGSILNPENAGLRFVLNVNNMLGEAKSPLYPVFDKKWKRVKEEAKGWFNTRTGAYKLGATNVTAVQSDTWVIHMLCQDDKLQVDDKALKECLTKVAASAKYEKATVHVSSLLVNAIPELKDLLTSQLIDEGISVSFYEEPV